MLKLLVIDDATERITDIEQEALFSFPDEEIQVLGARNMGEAERLFREQKSAFDLILLDLKLSEDEQGGLRLFRRFARQAPKVLYVLSSGLFPPSEDPTQNDFSPGSLRANFRIIPKSDRRDALVGVLRELLQRKSLAHSPAPC